MNNFNVIRSNIQTGDILLTRGIYSPISEVIAGITRSYWSHTVLYIGNNKIIESVYSGVKINPLDVYFTGENAVGLYRYINALTPERQAILVKFARKYAGLEYGWLQLMWQLILRLVGKNEDKDWNLDVSPGMICSELVARSYESVGIKFKNLPSYQMEPVDFDESPFTVRIA